jgi:hypothetical protein
MSDNDQLDAQAGDQEVSAADEDAALERTRRQLIADFAAAVGGYNDCANTNFNGALANFESTVRSASAQEATLDILNTMATTAFDEGVKLAIKELGEAAPAAGVVFALGKAIKKEMDRAAQAATSHEVGDWIKDLRAAANDAYTQSGTRAFLEQSATDMVADAGSEDDRQELIDNLTFATGAVQSGRWRAASVEDYERYLYEGWINAHFSFIGGVDDDVSGFIDVRFEADDAPTSATVVAPLGDKLADAINRISNRAGVNSLMDLAVRKRVCKWADNAVGGEGWSCGWFDDRNELINEPNSEEVTEFLNSTTWRGNVTMFR